ARGFTLPTASQPETQPALPSSFFLVRDAECARRARLADEAREHDDGQHVGDDLYELVRYLLAAEAHALELYGDGLCEAEQEAREHRLHGPPLAEDERGERDEAAPRSHVAREQRSEEHTSE